MLHLPSPSSQGAACVHPPAGKHQAYVLYDVLLAANDTASGCFRRGKGGVWTLTGTILQNWQRKRTCEAYPNQELRAQQNMHLPSLVSRPTSAQNCRLALASLLPHGQTRFPGSKDTPLPGDELRRVGGCRGLAVCVLGVGTKITRVTDDGLPAPCFMIATKG